MSQELRQTSFAGGEYSPSLRERTDLERYASGLAHALNAFVTEHGALKNRAGTIMVGKTANDGAAARLVRFRFSDDQAYALELSNSYIRWVAQGGFVLAPDAPDWEGATLYAVGDLVTHNGMVYRLDVAGVAGDAPGIFSGWTFIGMADAELGMVTPWTIAQVPRVKHAQSGDVVTFTHGDVAPRELKRYAHQKWKLQEIDYGTLPAWTPFRPAARGSSIVASDSTHPLKEWSWHITTLFDIDGRTIESAPVKVEYMADPGNPHWSPDPIYSVGMAVYWKGHDYVAINMASQRTVPDQNPTYWSDAGLAGFINAGPIPPLVVLYPDKPVTLQWDAQVWGPASSSAPYPVKGYRVYRSRGGIYGYVGETVDPWFTDEGSLPDFARTPPLGRDPFKGGSEAVPVWDYPAAVAYHEGRRYFAKLGRVQGSAIDDYASFDISYPARDDEAVDFTVASLEFEEIRSLASLPAGLVALGAGADWLLRGAGQDEPITATSILARTALQNPAAWLAPVLVGDGVIFAEARGGRVRDLAFEQGVRSSDLSIFARHLFEGREVVSWDYQASPDGILWVALDDGALLSCTYNREHQMLAWTHHAITGGLVESVCVIPESGKDRVYLVVKRGTTRYVELLADRDIDPEDPDTWVFLDGAVVYDDDLAPPTTTISGLEHFAGQSVYVWTGGQLYGPFTVIGGDIDIAAAIPAGVTRAVVGRLFDVEAETLAFPQGRGNQKIISKVSLEVEALPGTYQAGEALDALSAVTVSAPAGLADRDIEIRPRGRWAHSGSAAIKATTHGPLTIKAVRREVEPGGR